MSRVPLPHPRPGWVRLAVRAFGLNRSELHTRLGLSQGVAFPRVLGIEAVGVVDAQPEGEDRDGLVLGQQVATVLGGMGRAFDGGYAEFVVVPRRQVITFQSGLPWAVLGAVPETLQTAHGSLSIRLDLQRGQTLLIRGGTPARGLAAATLAKDRGATVLAMARQPERAAALRAQGADHAIVDDGQVARAVRAIVPKAWTPRWNWWARRTCPTPCAPRACTSRSVSPACCPTAGRWTSSTPSTTSRAASGSRPTPAAPTTCRRRCCRPGWTACPKAASPSGRRTPMCWTTFRARADLEHNRVFGKLVGVIDPADLAITAQR